MRKSQYQLYLSKPKWGFLSSTRHLSEETRPIKSKTCRFCMHSHLKASEGATVAQKFCPLDLFSKDPERIAVAVESLWSDWVSSEASINNLKVFLNGHKCDPTSVLILSAPHSVVVDLIVGYVGTRNFAECPRR